MLIVKGLYALFAPAVIMWLLSCALSNNIYSYVKTKIIASIIYCVLLLVISFAVLELHWVILTFLVDFRSTGIGLLFNIFSVIIVFVVASIYFIANKTPPHNKQFNVNSSADIPPPVR